MDHGESQSTGAPAPQTPEDKISALAQGMLSESQDDPNSWGQEEEAPEGEEQDEAPEQPQEPEVPAQEATEPEEELEEVEYAEGKKYKVPKELKRGWLREDDYTRKTQKLAEGFKQVTGLQEQLAQTQQVLMALAPHLGQLASLDQQIQALQAQMTPQLRQTDPVEFGALGTQFQLLLAQRGQLAQQLDQYQAQVTHAMQQTHSQVSRARLENELPKLLEEVGDFNPEKHGKEAAEYIRKRGYAPEAVAFINQSPLALADILAAMKWRQLQADKKTAQKKVEKLPPVAKPGQRASQAENDADLKKLRDLNRKTGGKDPAVRRELLRRQIFGR